MVCRSLRVVVGVVAIVHTFSDDSVEVRKAFELFIRDFDRNYTDSEQESRFAAFAKNSAYIDAQNAIESHTYTLGLTNFADWTHEEMAAISLPTDAGRGATERADRLRVDVHSGSNVTLGSRLDWREYGVITPVQNQGQCQSCWAFASASALASAWRIVQGQLQTLSAQQILDCALPGRYSCYSGGSAMMAIYGFINKAVCTMASDPYLMRDSSCRTDCTPGIPAGYIQNVGEVTANNEYALIVALTKQPIAAEINDVGLHHYNGGVYNGFCSNVVNHNVLVIGYGDWGGQPYWLVQNSWGVQWGMQGYFNIERGANSAGGGKCGILSNLAYPIMRHAGVAGELVV